MCSNVESEKIVPKKLQINVSQSSDQQRFHVHFGELKGWVSFVYGEWGILCLEIWCSVVQYEQTSKKSNPGTPVGARFYAAAL